MTANNVFDIKTDFLTIQIFLLHYTQMGAGTPLILVHGRGSRIYSFRQNM